MPKLSMAVGVNGSQSIPSKSTLSEREALELNDERFTMLFIDITSGSRECPNVLTVVLIYNTIWGGATKRKLLFINRPAGGYARSRIGAGIFLSYFEPGRDVSLQSIARWN